VAIPLAQAGYRVTGLDASESMLSEARRKAQEANVFIEWIKGDMRNFQLGKRFSLIVLPANTLCHLLAPADLEACLAHVKEHLASQGHFIIDVFNPRLDILMRGPQKRYSHSQYPDPNGRGMVEVSESNVYDRATQINHIRMFYKLPGKPEEIVEELKMRIYFPQELDALLKYNGFAIEGKFGDYDETPFTSDSPHQLVVCKGFNRSERA
jgi:SAM-dependent methyltransferase